MLQSKLNFTYSLVMSPDEAYGVLDENGKWTGLIGLLVQDQADMSINDLTITFDRAQVNHYFVLTKRNRLTQKLCYTSRVSKTDSGIPNYTYLQNFDKFNKVF